MATQHKQEEPIIRLTDSREREIAEIIEKVPDAVRREDRNIIQLVVPFEQNDPTRWRPVASIRPIRTFPKTGIEKGWPTSTPGEVQSIHPSDPDYVELGEHPESDATIAERQEPSDVQVIHPGDPDYVDFAVIPQVEGAAVPKERPLGQIVTDESVAVVPPTGPSEHAA